MVMLLRIFSVLACLCVALSCSADGSGAHGEALARFNQTLAELERVEQQCENAEVVLPRENFSGIHVDSKNILIALKYFYFKSKVACVDSAVKNYLVEATVLSYFSGSQDNDMTDQNQLVADSYIQLAKLKIKFDAIPESEKRILSTIPGVDKPFELVGSFENAGVN